ncbi:MAG TPA: DUF4019 domain-containing protein [Rhodanobacteraceae bacterium]
MSVRLLFCACLLGVAGMASAQQPAAQQRAPAQAPAHPAARQLTPQQRAALEKQNQILEKYAESITAMIDNGQVGQVWDQASPVAKHVVTRADFVKAVDAERAKLGKVKSRKLLGVTRSLSKGGKLPEGLYVNVNYETQFTNAAKPQRELVSFHLDNDKTWRLSGYTIENPAELRGTPTAR